MFDISFTELLLIGVVALVVIGPERLPRVARTIGHLIGRAQRYVGDVKSDIQREMEVDGLKDLKGQMEEAAKSVKTSVKAATDTLRDPLEDARKALQETTDSVESLVKSTQDELNDLSGAATESDASQQTEQPDPPRTADTTGPADAALTDALPESSIPASGVPADSSATDSTKPTADPVTAAPDTVVRHTAPASDKGDADTTSATASPPEPARLLSDAELADQRLAQAASPADAPHTNTSKHDQKPGTPL